MNGLQVKPDTAVVQALNLLLWGVYCLAYVLVFSTTWTDQTGLQIAYVVACSTIGLALCATSWQFIIAPAVRLSPTIGPALSARLAAAAVALGVAHALVTVVLEPAILGQPLGAFSAMVINNFVSFVFIYCLVFCAGVLMDLMRRDADRRERLALAESRATQAQLMALRLQINPHFVFNALNAIASLVALDRKDDAEEMIQRLSRFIRNVTDTSPHEFSALSNELEMAEEYLDVEAVRFQDRLNVMIETTPAVADFLVPNFILQPLVENAVKHGVGRNRGTTDVIIRTEPQSEGLRLVVENRCEDPCLGDVDASGLGIGLRNVKERLEALYGGRAGLDAMTTESGYRVVIELPEPPQGARRP